MDPHNCDDRLSLHSIGVGDGSDNLDLGDDRPGNTMVSIECTHEDDGRTGISAVDDLGLQSDQARRRFTWAAILGTVFVAPAFLWVLWGPWESPNPIRKTAFEDNFYDLQTRAMFHGHLWLAKGAIGIEAFVHGGREYTYFGLFPSILRMPILAVTSSLDGKLTAPFILVAWLLTALFASLLFWRIRLLMRGPVVMGRAEAASFGILVAAILGGSVFMILAVNPYVFNEDLAWSVCLAVGGLFALLGVLERPSWARVVVSGLFILAANLNRVTTGWALVVATLLIAVWLLLGRAGAEGRHWALPIAGAGLVPLIVAGAVNYSKFGVLIGVSNFDQVWTHVNAYRRQFLAANHDSESGIIFAPTTILTYLRPDGLRLTAVFPFITLPAGPPQGLFGVLFDRRYRTASIPASMPLLFVLSCWGMVTAFRSNPTVRLAPIRILLLAAGGAGALLFVWGYIAPRYLADFLPFLVLASGVAMVDVWRRAEAWSHKSRRWALATIATVAVFSILANIGMAVTPNEEWSTTQVLHYVEAQKTLSDLTGHPLNSRVRKGDSLPAWAPADQLFVVGNCDGLYISNGENYTTVPSQQFERTTWMAVERGQTFQHVYLSTFQRSGSPDRSTSLTRVGGKTVTVNATPVGRQDVRVTFGLYSATGSNYGYSIRVKSGSTHRVYVITDLAKHLVQVTMDGIVALTSQLSDGGPVQSAGSSHSTGFPRAVSVVDVTSASPQPTLCRSLIHR